MATIGQDLADQFERSWIMLRDVVKRFPAEQWLAGKEPDLVPARWAAHTLRAVDTYRYASPEEAQKHDRFPNTVNDARTGPTQAEVLAAMEELEADIVPRLRAATDGELMGPNAFQWTGDTLLSRWIYVLRHTHSHLGEMNMLLRTAGLEGGEWR